MKGVLNVGTYAGIPLRIHWTFGLLVLWFVYYGYSQGYSPFFLALFFGLIFSVFFCVILHEFGHAFAARSYGVKTRDILILPLGGLARLERIPKKPIVEFVITIAGPLVNLAIAIVLGIISYIMGPIEADVSFAVPLQQLASVHGFIQTIAVLNVMLFFFNLIPAFPMDGGRLVRSLLAMRFGHVRATRFATLLGQFFGVLFVLYGAYNGELIIAFIGAFVFISARSENRHVQKAHFIETASIADVVNPTFSRFRYSQPLRVLVDEFSKGKERNFLVFDDAGNETVGTVPTLFIQNALDQKLDLDNTTIGEIASMRIMPMDISDSFQTLFHNMNEKGIAIVPVLKNEQLVGIVDRDGLMQKLGST